MNVKQLSRDINAVAREQYPALDAQLGINNPIATRLTRMALRLETTYPYNLTEDDAFYPKGATGFGRVIQAGREEGLRAIHSEIEFREFEHAWAYWSGADVWVDVTTGANDADVEQDQFLQVFLSHLGADLETVHTHPDKVVERVAATSPMLDFGPDIRGGAAAPSSTDLITLAQMSARVNQQAPYSHAVVSHYGVTTYMLTNRLNAHKDRTYGVVNLNVDPVRPIEGIRSMLAHYAASSLTFENRPAFVMNFEPLQK